MNYYRTEGPSSQMIITSNVIGKNEVLHSECTALANRKRVPFQHDTLKSKETPGKIK